MLYTLCLGLFLPLLGFLTLLAASFKIHRWAAGLVACLTVLLSFFCFASLAYLYDDPRTITLFQWIPVPGIDADFALRMDALSLVMALVITGVGFLIHVYSIGYMDHEEDFARYFACLNFFVFAMLLLVLAANLLLLFIGWEGVGLASYLLIGFWYQRPSAAQAAAKAFVVNRIGDFGLLLGLLLTLQLFGTSDIAVISERAQAGFSIGAPLLTVTTLLYFWGAIGKSAQLPLYTWLPDAMEGPTPVSALIHAATMVTAGVYLLVRMHAVFMMAPETLYVVSYVGGITALFAALCASAQTDLKRVLAYSTVSQLGLMFLACGIGAFYSAMFHLTTHAFTKALLFLSAGNVIHMMHGVTDMEKMGGLSKIFTKTHWLFLIGALSMAGVPPLAAFFSKDLILEQEYLAGFEVLFFVGFAASILTAFYLARAYCLTFTGSFRADSHVLQSVKEAPYVMLIPVVLLAILSFGGGFLGMSEGMAPPLESFLNEIGITPTERELSTHFHLTPEVWLTIGGAFFGIGAAVLLYTRFSGYLGKPIALLKNAFFVDELYSRLIVRPLKAFADFIAQAVEPEFFGRLINETTQAIQKTAHWIQKAQSGQIRSYAAWMVAGTAIIIVYLVFSGVSHA